MAALDYVIVLLDWAGYMIPIDIKEDNKLHKDNRVYLSAIELRVTL